MDKKTHIKNLLERYHQQTLSSLEHQDLLKILEQEDPDFNSHLEEVWNHTSETSQEFSPDLEWIQLKKGLSEDFNPERGEVEDRIRIRSLIIKSLSYAAVLIAGIMISWFFIQTNQSGHYSENDMIVNVALGSKSNLILPDGTRVHLNAGSVLRYPHSFGSKVRVVELTGEGFFEVTHDQSLPFLVKTKDLMVRVFGTQFNLKSYPEDKTTETILMKGSVGFYSANESMDHILVDEPLVRLHPGQRATARHSENKPLQIVIDNLSNPELYSDWRNNVLVFSNEPFSSVITKLERWYNIRVILNNEKLAGVKLSGRFNRESVDDVLRALQLLQAFRYQVNKNIVEIY